MSNSLIGYAMAPSRLILKTSLIPGFCGLSRKWLGRFRDVQSRRNWARCGKAGSARIRQVGSAKKMALNSSGRSLSHNYLY